MEFFTKGYASLSSRIIAATGAIIVSILLVACSAKTPEGQASMKNDLPIAIAEMAPEYDVASEYKIFPDGKVELREQQKVREFVAPKETYKNVIATMAPLRGKFATDNNKALWSWSPEVRNLPSIECGALNKEQTHFAVAWNGATDTSFDDFDLKQQSIIDAGCQSPQAQAAVKRLRNAIDLIRNSEAKSKK